MLVTSQSVVVLVCLYVCMYFYNGFMAASFPGPAQLSVASSAVKWERASQALPKI